MLGSGVGRQCLLFCPARVGLVRLEPRGGLVTAGDHLLGTPSEAAGGVCSPCSAKAVEGRVWASASSGQRPRKPVRDHRGPPAVTEHLPCGAVLGWCGGRPPSHPPAQAVVPTPPALQNFRRNPDIGRCQAEEELPVAGGGGRGPPGAGAPGRGGRGASAGPGALALTTLPRLVSARVLSAPPPHPGAPHPPCSFPSPSCPSGFVAASLPLQGPRLPRPLVPRSPQALSPARHPGRAGLCRLWAVWPPWALSPALPVCSQPPGVSSVGFGGRHPRGPASWVFLPLPSVSVVTPQGPTGQT